MFYAIVELRIFDYIPPLYTVWRDLTLLFAFSSSSCLLPRLCIFVSTLTFVLWSHRWNRPDLDRTTGIAVATQGVALAELDNGKRERRR